MAETSISGIEFKIVGTTGKAKSAVDKLTASLKGLKTALHTTSAKKLEKDLEGVEKSSKKTTTTLGKLFKSIGRIGFYRAIRSALKFITEGFKEGLDNAYQFSKIVGYDLAATMDTLATKSLTMKNQLGSAFGSLIMAVEPILLQLIALVTKAANALARFFAGIAGKDTYLKAVDTVTQYGEAVSGVGEAAKEAMKYLAPFDELNVLPGDKGGSSGGSGASTPDYSTMFEEAPVSQALKDFATDFKITVSDVLFDWSDLTNEQIAEKVLAALFGIVGLVTGIALTGTLTGGLTFAVLGVALGLIADTFIFDHDGVLEQSEIAHSLQYVLNALAGGVVGFTIGGPGGAVIGAAVGIGISLLANAAELLPGNSIVNTDVLLDQLTVALGMLTGGIIGFSVGGPAGALIGAVIGLGVTAAITALKFDNQSGELSGESGRTGLDYFVVDVLGMPSNEEWKTYGENIWKKIKEGSGAGWKSFKEGWTDFKTELYNIFIKPIVDAFDEFAQNHPVIAKFLGIENGASDVITPGAEAANSMWNIDIEADIKSVKDSVPPEDKVSGNWTANMEEADDEKLPLWKRVINKVKGIFSDTDSSELSKDKTTLDTTANFQYWTGQSALSMDRKTFDATANFQYWTGNSALSTDRKTFDTVANFVYWGGQNTLPTEKKTFDTKANFTSWGGQSTLPMEKRTFDSKANFTYWGGEDSLPIEKRTFGSKANFIYWGGEDTLPIAKRTFGSKARFNEYEDNLVNPWLSTMASFDSYEDMLVDPSLNAEASFNSWRNNFPENSTPWSYAKAWFDSWSNSFDANNSPWANAKAWFDDWGNGLQYKPQIECEAYFTGTGGKFASGGAFFGGSWHEIPQYAGGTTKARGSMFVAGEAGPEVVGHIGGRTEVLNRSQLAATMYASVRNAMSGVQFNVSGMKTPTSAQAESYDEETMYRAMLRALNDSDVFPDEIDLDGDVVYRKMVQRNRNEQRRLGVNPMMAS